MKKTNPNNLQKTAHDLNNLLTSINLSAEMLLEEFYGQINGKQKKYLKIILSEGKKMKNLIKKIK